MGGDEEKSIFKHISLSLPPLRTLLLYILLKGGREAERTAGEHASDADGAVAVAKPGDGEISHGSAE